MRSVTLVRFEALLILVVPLFASMVVFVMDRTGDSRDSDFAVTVIEVRPAGVLAPLLGLLRRHHLLQSVL